VFSLSALYHWLLPFGCLIT